MMATTSSSSTVSTSQSSSTDATAIRNGSMGSDDQEEPSKQVQWDAAAEDHHKSGHFTLAGSVKLAKHIEEQVRSSNLSDQQRGSKLVYITLLIAAIAFGVATFMFLNMAQSKTFQSEFESYAREAANVAENNAGNTFGQLKSLALAITSLNLHHESEFPCHTMPHFDLRAQEISDHSGVEMLAFVPFVPIEEKQNYSQYAVDNQYWVWQDYDHRGWNTSNIQSIPDEIHSYPLPPDYTEERRGFVDDGFMQGILTNLSYNPQGFTAPVSQFGPGPVNTSLAMMDLFSHPIFKKEMLTALEYEVPVISEAEDLGFLLEHIYTNDQHDKSMLRSFTLDHVKENFNDGARTVGYLVGVLPWELFFRNLLPPNINGIVIKVASDCGKNLTYIVNGGKDDWAAEGDWHDPKYEHMMQQYQFFWKDHPQGISRHCHFDFHIYPSDEFAALYESNDPITFALVVVSIIAFVAIVFYAYDRYMRKRQTTHMSEKAREESVVTALFPPHVSAKILAEKHDGRTSIPNIMSLTDAKTADDTKPLADLFPSATIMFADIAGFTNWSSQREPHMVFTLLENLYQAFDILAKEQQVFKIETIGDCYVAVAGLPAKCPEHSVVMATFAKSCLQKFGQIVDRLVPELGRETATLGLRTGLHSGPVTAGLLRGERARYQIFGDSVNTTARIESLGKPGRIHLSEHCAQELMILGKGDWLIPRADRVNAKGKGQLKTYWLRLDHETTASRMDESVMTHFTDEESGMIGSAKATQLKYLLASVAQQTR